MTGWQLGEQENLVDIDNLKERLEEINNNTNVQFENFNKQLQQIINVQQASAAQQATNQQRPQQTGSTAYQPSQLSAVAPWNYTFNEEVMQRLNALEYSMFVLSGQASIANGLLKSVAEATDPTDRNKSRIGLQTLSGRILSIKRYFTNIMNLRRQ